MFGTWDGTSPCVLVADGTWPIPWPFITRWKLAASAPPWPAVPAPPVWKDTYAHPPALDEACWVRRFPPDTSVFRARFMLADEPYFLLTCGWQLPWYLAWHWKT